MSQERFGKRVGISGKSISAYETGRCVPTIRVLKQISSTFNIVFIEIPNDNRKSLKDKLDELENSFDELKRVIDEIIPQDR